MSRRIIYKIDAKAEYFISDEEWDEVRRLQHWYNSEFSWSTGKLAFRRYLLFPNVEEFSGLDRSIWSIIDERKGKLKLEGRSESEIVDQLEQDHLVFVKWGGYFDGCLASGYTRVADNEWNAFLVCDFLLKVSTLLPHVVIEVRDEGQFVRTGRLWLRDGIALLKRRRGKASAALSQMIKQKQFFAVVDPTEFERHPSFKNLIPEFNELPKEDRQAVVRNWNWLGYGNGKSGESKDLAGGVNLNIKLRGFDFL